MVQKTRVAILLLIVLMLVVPTLPGVAAQKAWVTRYHQDVAIHPPADRVLTPLTESTVLKVETVWECSGLTTPDEHGFMVRNLVDIDLPADVHVTPTQYHVPFDTTSCLTGMTFVQTSAVSIRMGPSAPAFKTVDLQFVSDPDSPLAGPSKAEKIQLKADFAGGLLPRVDDALVVADPDGTATYNLELRNRANGDIRARVAPDEDNPEAVQIPDIVQLVVPSTVAGRDTDAITVPVPITVPRAEATTQVYSFALLVTGHSTQDREAAIDPVRIPLVVVVPAHGGTTIASSGEVVEAPATVLPGLGLLAALGVAARRRRS